ncbi:hypothetical protein [Bacillus massilinigeriensis]|uniref:hypothetical protein n=1 Tax=Bacillus mediterraneensis TaxID=1805474 RepID=UPI0008F82CD7|nr:hypothetical protein [Bacillus mediterraneensis]
MRKLVFYLRGEWRILLPLQVRKVGPHLAAMTLAIFTIVNAKLLHTAKSNGGVFIGKELGDRWYKPWLCQSKQLLLKFDIN